jgi:ribosome maturation factor RimP
MKAQVETLLTDALAERPDLFLINWEINNENHIKIIIDGDQGVRVQDCIDISRAVEHNLDREAWDFSIEVLSAGVTEPLEQKRQYQKNIGRVLKVKLQDQEVEGELISIADQAFTLSYQVREKKPVGKGYVKIQKEQEIAFDAVVRATVMIKF